MDTCCKGEVRVSRYRIDLSGLKPDGKVFGAVLLGFALLLGGGSVYFPRPRLIIETVSAGVLIGYAMRGWRAPVDRWTQAAILLILLMLALPLVQLIPLPPSVWTALPGREEAARVIQIEGLAPRWMPISLQPDATRLATAFLIPPITMFIATLHATPAQRVLYGWTIVAMALGGALLGLLQTNGSTAFYLYNTGGYTAATGFFANKNHHADLLLVAMLLASALTITGKRLGLPSPSKPMAAGAITVLVLAMVAANSRMGLLLLPVALLPAILLLLPSDYYRWVGHRRVGRREVVPAAAILAVLVLIAQSSGVVIRLLDRFGAEPDARWKFWPDVNRAIGHYQPVGSGLGSFVSIFQRHESMSTLTFTYIPHAHNDVMEIVLETGWVGIALIIFGVALWLVAAWRALRPSARDAFTPVHIACVVGVTIIAAHSLVDYPLRTLGLACVLAFLVGCLTPATATVGATLAKQRD